jgi:hypothetical protein
MLTLAVVGSWSAAALASDPLSVGVQPLPQGTRIQGTVNYTWDGQTATYVGTQQRQQKHVSYSSLGYARFFFPAGANVAVADDLYLEKIGDPDKQAMQSFTFAYFSSQGPDVVKIDFYDSGGGAYYPNTALKFATINVPVPAGAYYITVTLDTPLDKPDAIWASFQAGRAGNGLLIDDLLPTVGFSEDLFARNLSKDNNATWGLFWFGGGGGANPYANFFWEITNVPEPGTMLLLIGGAAGLIARRRR